MENLVNYAKSYAEHGFSVIPIVNKRPLVKFANRPALTKEEIDAIWTKHPTASIALQTREFLVIDVDRHEGGDGMESIKALGHNEWFKGTLCERTRSGGFHFYFRKPAKQKITQNIGFLPHVDIKAHDNNYVVVAPSPGYKWLNHKPIQPLPDGLLELILQKQAETKPSTGVEAGYKVDSKSATTALFEQIVDGLGATGGRNNALASFVGGLLYRGVDPYKAAQLALLANANTKDKLTTAEVEKTVNSMIEKELRRRESIDE